MRGLLLATLALLTPLASSNSGLERSCREQETAVWSEASGSCLVHFNQNLSWADAMYFCGRFKPSRSFGRLLHIQSPEALAFADAALPSVPFWLGMRSTLKGSPEFLSHWRWMEDLFTESRQPPWNPGPSVSLQIGRQQQCLRKETGAWVETGCDVELPFVCEYVPEPRHFCASHNESVWLPSKSSCLVAFKPHLPWTEAMQYCAKKAPQGLVGRLAHLDTVEVIDFLKGRLPRQYLWIGLRSLTRRSKDVQRDWRWMTDPLTPVEAHPIDFAQHIRVDMNQEWADCMNILDDRLNDYFCHEALPFICEFHLPQPTDKKTVSIAASDRAAPEDNNHLHRDISATINAVNGQGKPDRAGRAPAKTRSAAKPVLPPRRPQPTKAQRPPVSNRVQPIPQQQSRPQSAQRQPPPRPQQQPQVRPRQPQPTPQQPRPQLPQRPPQRLPVQANEQVQRNVRPIVQRPPLPPVAEPEPSPEAPHHHQTPQVAPTLPVAEPSAVHAQHEFPVPEPASAPHPAQQQNAKPEPEPHAVPEVTPDHSAAVAEPSAPVAQPRGPIDGPTSPQIPKENHRQFPPRNISGVPIFRGEDITSNAQEVRSRVEEAVPAGLVRRVPTELLPTPDPALKGLVARRPTEPRVRLPAPPALPNHPGRSQLTLPPRPVPTPQPEPQAEPASHKAHSQPQPESQPRVPHPVPEPAQPFPEPAPLHPTSTHHTHAAHELSHRAPVQVEHQEVWKAPVRLNESWGPPEIDPSWEPFTPLPPAPESTAYVPWERPSSELVEDPTTAAPTTTPPPPTRPPTTTTTQAPTTTTAYDPRPADVKLQEHCGQNPNGVWSQSLQTCFVWFRRARDWAGAMSSCQQTAPRAFAVGRLAHIVSDETVELIRSRISARSRLFWIAAQRRGEEGPRPLESWKWMDNQEDFVQGARVYDPSSMGVRLRLRQAQSDCLVWRGSSWAATPCHFYVSFLCEYLPYEL